MPKLRLRYHPAVCIGAFDCVAADGRHFDRNDRGTKAVLRGAPLQGDEVQEITFTTDDVEPVLAAARVCPVAAITLEDLTSKRRLA